MEKIDLPGRYGYVHSLEYISNNLWQFKPDPKSTGGFRLLGFPGEHKIRYNVYSLDPEGGPFMTIGDKVGDYTIKSITMNGIFELVKNNNNEES